MNYTTHILSNGLKVAVCKTDAKVAYIGVVVGSGSRDEGCDHLGLAHFVEHTIFKGTWKRRSSAISARMESIGGELNAYTSKEDTVLYTSAPPAMPTVRLNSSPTSLSTLSFPNRKCSWSMTWWWRR